MPSAFKGHLTDAKPLCDQGIDSSKVITADKWVGLGGMLEIIGGVLLILGLFTASMPLS